MVTTNLRRAIRALSIAAALVLGARAPARAEPPPAPPKDHAPGEPRAHHDPIASAKAGEDLRIVVTFDHEASFRSPVVVFTSPRAPGVRAVPLLRGEARGYVAIIPASELVAPGIAYAIEVERLDGGRAPLFASRAEMQPVQVMEDRMDARERALLKRLEGRRSVVTTAGEFVRFGTTTGKTQIPCAKGQSVCTPGKLVIPVVDDQYWRVEAGYTYRPLRTVAQFGLRIGVVRGTSLVESPTLDASRYKVGLNYAAPSVRFRFADAWHIDLELVASITEIGFSVGGGGALLIGDPYGTRLTLGAEAVGVTKGTYFGSRFYTRFDVAIHQRVTVAPVIEVTDMPHADAFGVRLYGDVNAHIYKGFSLGVRGGYQARRSTSGGVGLGGTASLAF